MTTDAPRETPDSADDSAITALNAEVARLRADGAAAVARYEAAESALTRVRSQNERLVETLEEARNHILTLKAEVDRLAQPPWGFGQFLSAHPDGTASIFHGGRQMRVTVGPGVDAAALQLGQMVMLNEALNIVEARDFERLGDVVEVRDLLADGERAIVKTHTDEERVVVLAVPLRHALERGELVMMEPRAGIAYERLPSVELGSLVIEEIAPVSFDHIGGLDPQITALRDAVELPFIHRMLFERYELQGPKGILLYGPPGCGKTLLVKALAHAMSQLAPEPWRGFISIKGPELLNKYVGETERQLRLIFESARERARQGGPVIVFFDEMDAIFRTRGGASNELDTLVPQLLTELDGFVPLENVVVIGASSREDIIDPAILRPGRLDMKLRIGRPDANGARAIFDKYLTERLPVAAEEVATYGSRPEAVVAMIDNAVEALFSTDDSNRFLEVTFESGVKETLYFKDFVSGAVIRNIVHRVKRGAVKRVLSGEADGICRDDFNRAIQQEFAENQSLPDAANTDDWLRIAGRRGERVVFARTVIEGGDAQGGPVG